jgi:hypothetical protein
MGAFLAPAAVILGIGLAVSPDRRWKRDVGIVLTSSAAFGAFVVFTMVCVFMEPEFRKMVQPEKMAMFSDYVTGTVWIALMGALGGLALHAGREQPER